MSVEAFVRIGRRFVEFVDSSDDLSAGDFLRELQPLLVNLYATGLALGSGDPDDTADLPDSLTGDDWQALYRRLGAQLRGYDDYAFVFEPHELSATPVVGSLSDDVADIYLELRNGFTLFDEGKPGEAAWEWRFGFDNHWGRHAAHAIYALHTLHVPTIR